MAPRDDDETRGLTLRELVLEVRGDVKVLTDRVGSLETSATTRSAGLLAVVQTIGVVRTTALLIFSAMGAAAAAANLIARL
jgi:hypothetical protein